MNNLTEKHGVTAYKNSDTSSTPSVRPRPRFTTNSLESAAIKNDELAAPIEGRGNDITHGRNDGIFTGEANTVTGAQTQIALEDELCTHLFIHSPSDSPSSNNPVSSPSSNILSSSSCSQIIDSTVTINSSSFADGGRGQKSRKVKEDLNWSDRAELMKHKNIFDEPIRKQLERVAQKENEFGDGFKQGNYFSNVYPILVSGFEHAEKIACCGCWITGKRRPCRRWMFCSRCAYYKGTESLLRYQQAFKRSTFYHLTCCFDGGVSLTSTNSTHLRRYWNANARAIKEAVDRGIIEGAYLVHEISILQFLPLRVVPHSHVLICGDNIDEADVAEISELIAERVDLEPSLVCKPINDLRGFKHVVQRYQTKAMKLQEPYVSALDRHGHEHIRQLNLEMKNFLSDVSAAIDHFPRIKRLGRLDPKAKGYWGNKKWKKSKRQKFKEEYAKACYREF